jgi:hypothetical protein
MKKLQVLTRNAEVASATFNAKEQALHCNADVEGDTQ